MDGLRPSYGWLDTHRMIHFLNDLFWLTSRLVYYSIYYVCSNLLPKAEYIEKSNRRFRINVNVLFLLTSPTTPQSFSFIEPLCIVPWMWQFFITTKQSDMVTLPRSLLPISISTWFWNDKHCPASATDIELDIHCITVASPVPSSNAVCSQRNHKAHTSQSKQWSHSFVKCSGRLSITLANLDDRARNQHTIIPIILISVLTLM